MSFLRNLQAPKKLQTSSVVGNGKDILSHPPGRRQSSGQHCELSQGGIGQSSGRKLI